MQPNALPDGRIGMGIGMRHVVWTSTAMALGAFLYVVTLEPMDEQANPRAAALNQSPSSNQLVAQIRRSLGDGQLGAAQAQAQELFGQGTEDVRSLYYCGIVERALGNEGAARNYWRMIINLIEQREDGSIGASPELYYYAWAQHEEGDPDTGRQLFGQLADQYEHNSKDGEDRWGGLGALDHYNLACYRAMAGETERAMEHWAFAVELGYGRGYGQGDDYGWWAADPDLQALHDIERFWVLGSGIDPKGRGEERAGERVPPAGDQNQNQDQPIGAPIDGPDASDG